MNGNIIGWNTTQWNTTNMVMVETPQEEICQSPKIGPILFQNKMNFEDAKTLCHGFKGTIPLIEDQQYQDKITNIFKNDSKCNFKLLCFCFYNRITYKYELLM